MVLYIGYNSVQQYESVLTTFFNVLLTPFIVYLYINWLQMYTSKQGQEALSELVSNLLDAIG